MATGGRSGVGRRAARIILTGEFYGLPQAENFWEHKAGWKRPRVTLPPPSSSPSSFIAFLVPTPISLSLALGAIPVWVWTPVWSEALPAPF